jgi:hypothetical protein
MLILVPAMHLPMLFPVIPMQVAAFPFMALVEARTLLRMPLMDGGGSLRFLFLRPLNGCAS